VAAAVAVATMPLATAGAARADDSLTTTPSLDTYVDAAQPGTSYGTSASLWVDSDTEKDAYLLFQVQGIGSRTVTDVTLGLYQQDPSPDGGEVYSTTSTSWDEAMTWDTRPAIDGTQLASFGAVSTGTTYQVDLGTPFTQDGTYAFGMKSTNSDAAKWGSRESSHPAQLTISLAPVQPPTNVDTLSYNPTLDTYVDASQADASFGSLASTWVDASPAKQSYFQFAVSGLAGRSVEDVRLRLYQIDSSPVGGRVFSISSNAWNESMTWNARPAVDGPQIGSFGAVSNGQWYEADLGRAITQDGTYSLALDSTCSDGARWDSRESSRAPQLLVAVDKQSGLVLDGLTQVAGQWSGSSDPTSFADNRRLAVTAGGRLLVVHGLHATGVQLSWRDPGGGWLQTTTGDLPDGVLENNGSTGDRAASIVVAADPSGVQHAWVVWSAQAAGGAVAVTMRRIGNLDDPNGPSVGPAVTVAAADPGNSKADVAFETASGGTLRGCIAWVRQVDPSSYAVTATWFTDLTADTPSFTGQADLLSASGGGRQPTLVPTNDGMALFIRNKNGALQEYLHQSADPLTKWSSKGTGVSVSASASPGGVALSNGDLLAAIESDTTSHVVVVQRFRSKGHGVPVDLQLTGYEQPTIATDGTNAWLVMVRISDGYVVSRSYSGTSWSSTDVLEIGSAGGGNYDWPNLLRQTDGRLRFVVRGPTPSSGRSAVLAFQRLL